MAKEDLIPFVKGQSGNPNGRPRKLTSKINAELKRKGVERLTNGQMIDALRHMLNFSRVELIEISKDKTLPILYSLVAKELLGKNGGRHLELILDRVFGKAKPSQEELDSIKDNSPRVLIISNGSDKD